MANKEQGHVTLNAGDVTYKLVLDMDAMVALEEHFSTPSHDATWDEIEQKIRKGSVRIVRALFWAMLQRHHPGTSLVEAGHIIDEAGGILKLERVLRGVTKAMLPDKADVKEVGEPKGNPQKAEANRKGGAGETSTLTDAVSA